MQKFLVLVIFLFVASCASTPTAKQDDLAHSQPAIPCRLEQATAALSAAESKLAAAKRAHDVNANENTEVALQLAVANRAAASADLYQIREHECQ